LQGVYVCSSDICDFEVRRGLVLALRNKPEFNGIQNLDEIREIIDFLPINSSLLRQAAHLWASARSQGTPTADNKSLDVDIIISAHWQVLKESFPGRYIVVATTNVKYLSRFTEAKVWNNIKF
jgi:predicted nucleic acid-binding protein